MMILKEHEPKEIAIEYPNFVALEIADALNKAENPNQIISDLIG
jgi:hypothetical protein